MADPLTRAAHTTTAANAAIQNRDVMDGDGIAMNWFSMEVFAESRRADLLEEAEARKLLRGGRPAMPSAKAPVSIRERLRLAIIRRFTRPAGTS